MWLGFVNLAIYVRELFRKVVSLRYLWGKMPLTDTPFKRVAVDIFGPTEPRSDKKSR